MVVGIEMHDVRGDEEEERDCVVLAAAETGISHGGNTVQNFKYDGYVKRERACMRCGESTRTVTPCHEANLASSSSVVATTSSSRRKILAES